MSKSKKLLLGVLSFLPAVLTFTYVVFFFSIFINVMRTHHHDPETVQELMFQNFAWIMALALLMGACSLALKIYFIVHAINNTFIDGSERIVWILVFVFAGLIGYPVYWYMRIWKEQAPLQNNYR